MQTHECGRCQSANLCVAQLEHGLRFCLDHDTHHGVRNVGFEATVCRDCGYTEFWAKDPLHAMGSGADLHTSILQEEDF